ncbi:MAG: translation initiation factor IF-3 [Candidatus Enteromonas sp.]|nr:translation initiation factor IF-3 [bacterium]MDY6101086.1 translation initiation factor IF-3 [Candidatus Enteromonas sp.]
MHASKDVESSRTRARQIPIGNWPRTTEPSISNRNGASAASFFRLRRKATIRYFSKQERRPQKRFDPINEHVRYPVVMVIGPEGQNLGRMSSREANALAATYNLDLFCVAPNANPPVCKILNYGKYRFEQQKKDRELKKNSKQAELKEVQLHISIGEHDIQTKAKKAKEFIEDGDKVNIRVILKGREMAHKDLGEALLNKFVAILQENGEIQFAKPAFWEGKCFSAIVAKKKK